MISALPRAAFLFLALAGSASASSSNVVSADGVDLRLVSAGAPSDDGRIDAVLEVALQPGWKTYWIDPGEAGVPPSLTLSPGGETLSLRLPAPSIIDEGELKLVGYDRPVRFVASIPAGSGLVEAEVFLGVCEKICVPVGGKLTLDPAHDADNPRDTAIVEEARLALPGAAQADFSATLASVAESSLSVAAAFPAGDAALFVASAEGWLAGGAARSEAGFSVPLTRDGNAPWPKDGLYYVLVADGRAVEGRLTLP